MILPYSGDFSGLPVLSGIEAWSVFLSFLKTIFPSWRTDDTTFRIAARKSKTERSWGNIFDYFYFADVFSPAWLLKRAHTLLSLSPQQLRVTNLGLFLAYHSSLLKDKPASLVGTIVLN